MTYKASYKEDERLDKHTAKRVGDYLFRFPDSQDTRKEEIGDEDIKIDSRGLESRTRISGPNTMAALTFYGILRDHFDCKAAQEVSDILMRLMISTNGDGRKEGVEILRGSLPKEVEISRGVA